MSSVERFSCTAQGSGVLGDTKVQITGTEYSFVVDEPEEDGGKGQNANPMQFFIAALAACENEQAAVVAVELKISVSTIDFKVDVDLDLAGFGGDNPGLAQPFVQAVIQATVTTDGTDEQVAALGDAVGARCPVRRLLVNSGVAVRSSYAKAGGKPGHPVDVGPAPAEPVERFSCTAQGSGVLGDTKVQITGTEYSFVVDEPEEDGGKGQNANPMQFFIAALAACENEQAAVVAGELKISVSGIEWSVDVDLDLAGFAGDNPGLAQPYTGAAVKATVHTDSTAAQVESLGASVGARCPIRRLLVNSGVAVAAAFTKA